MVRVRFAPSPTGFLHIGGLRTALYNFLFARQQHGAFLLRIEDTDSTRFVPGAQAYILKALDWLGITPDEAPIIQSQRKDVYRHFAHQLVDNGFAYFAFDTPAELQALRDGNPNFQYDATSRHRLRNSLTLSDAYTKALLHHKHPYTIRIKILPNQPIAFHDLIRGDISVNSSTLDDKVLWKSSDGMPTYHLANVVDDHASTISHVIRGEEWLPSAPLHLLLYRYLGWESDTPHFAHLALILKPDGNGKLSKRDGERLGFPVFALDYKELGFLPHALINFIALLGWNPGHDRELLSLHELIQEFDLSHCARSGAKFDFEKAKWFNRQYLQLTDDQLLLPDFQQQLNLKGFHPSHDFILNVIRLTKPRISLTSELLPQAEFFFSAPTSYDPKTLRKRWTADSPAQLAALADSLPTLDLTQPLTGLNANLLTLLRLALVGQPKGPDLIDIIATLGIPESIKRIHACIQSLSTPTSA